MSVVLRRTVLGFDKKGDFQIYDGDVDDHVTSKYNFALRKFFAIIKYSILAASYNVDEVS